MYYIHIDIFVFYSIQKNSDHMCLTLYDILALFDFISHKIQNANERKFQANLELFKQKN